MLRHGGATPTGRTKICVIWDLSVTKIGGTKGQTARILKDGAIKNSAVGFAAVADAGDR